MTHSVQSELFNLWAEVYDTAANPLLILEEQTLPPLLPSIAGLHVLDVGCGTGRWLSRLAALQPASLIGTDNSAEMLRRARGKLAAAVHLLRSDAHAIPVPDGSQDVIMSSFVLSYLEDLPAFASECARVLKPGGHLLLSDMHPKTARRRGWTRSFAAKDETFHINARSPQLSRIIKSFSRAGFRVSALHTPPFASEQRSAFEEAGRLEDFLALAHVPAIYLLRLRKPMDAQWPAGAASSASPNISSAQWSTSPSMSSDAPLSLGNGHIAPDRAVFHSVGPILGNGNVGLSGKQVRHRLSR